MNWREVNERNRPRLQGEAGVYRVASELLLRGFNPMFPSVDCGADLIVEGGVRIQVKSGHLRTGSKIYPDGAYWFKLTRGPVAHGNHGLRKRAPRVFSDECEFVIFWGIEQNRFWIVPATICDEKSLLVLGPDVSWVGIDIARAKELHQQGWSYQQLAEHFNTSRMTIKRRLEDLSKLDSPHAIAAKVRGCENQWESITACVELVTGTPQTVSTVGNGEILCQQEE